MAFEGYVQDFPEASRSPDELRRRAREVGWYHTLRLGDDLTTPGIFDLDSFVPYYLIPGSLRGLDCLEVGAGNGYWSFILERRGARRVVATDIGNFADTDFSTPCEPMADGLPAVLNVPAGTLDPDFGEPYRLAATLLRSRVKYQICSVYDLSPAAVGTHDFVFCGSMLMHLFGPLLALRRMASVCRNTFLICTQTDLTLDGQPLVQYLGHLCAYAHFIPSPVALGQMVRTCGYREVVRGPTFNLHYRDRVKDPAPICHTSFFGLWDPQDSCVPPPQLVPAGERRARIEVVSSPDRVGVGQPFEVYVRVHNVSRADWRGGDGSTRLKLGYEVQALDRRGRVRSTRTVESDLPFLDYLPKGLDSLAKLVVPAPPEAGRAVVRPFVCQDGIAFQGDPTRCTVSVGGTAGGSLRELLPPGVRALLRRIKHLPDLLDRDGGRRVAR